jgi:hypothetical protein
MDRAASRHTSTSERQVRHWDIEHSHEVVIVIQEGGLSTEEAERQ